MNYQQLFERCKKCVSGKNSEQLTAITHLHNVEYPPSYGIVADSFRDMLFIAAAIYGSEPDDPDELSEFDRLVTQFETTVRKWESENDHNSRD